MIDSHLHLQDPVLFDNLNAVLYDAREAGVDRMVVNGTTPDDWASVSDLAQSIPEVSAFYGLHPWYVNEYPDGWQESLRYILTKNPLAGVGEIGLDKWIPNRDWVRQQEAFLTQLGLAHELQRPATIHCLKAWGKLLECLDNSRFDGAFLLHSYSGPADLVNEFVERGSYFSISGYFFRQDKMAKLKVFELVPEDRLLLETDAPDMMPPKALIRKSIMRSESGGPANHPANLVGVYEAYSEWAGISMEETKAMMIQNFSAWHSR
jgi:TatD DNase family protein